MSGPWTPPDAPAARAEREYTALFRIQERHANDAGRRDRARHPAMISPGEAVRLLAGLAAGGLVLEDGEDAVDAADLTAALTLMPMVRAEADQVEATLLTIARARGMTWQELAFGLGLGSAQAARQRYERLSLRTAPDGPRPGDGDRLSGYPVIRFSAFRRGRGHPGARPLDWTGERSSRGVASMNPITDPAHAESVTAELNYLAPGSTVLRRFTAPGNSVNTGTYQTHRMPVRDGRPVRDQFTLGRNGFALIDHSSAVNDFTDRAEVDQVYAAETAALVKARTGADRVAPQRAMLRRSADPGAHASQPQAANVHCDYSVTGAVPTARRVYESRFPDGPGYRRALITSLWRVFSPPPQDWPLAVCDYRSVRPDEGLDNRLYFVDEIPADLYADLPADAPGTSGFEFRHSPAHQWWYFPGMTRDEVLLITLNDSDQSRAWRVPHSAFFDGTAQAVVPRHSIEYRTIAYFE